MGSQLCSTSFRKLARAVALVSTALSLGAFGCAGEESAPDIDLPGEGAAPELPAGALVVSEFKARLDPKTKTLTFERIEREGDLGARSIDDIPIEQDGVAGSGPANTVELVTNSVDTSVPGVFTANVTLRHFLPRPLSNVFVQIYDMEPKDSAYYAIGDDPSEYGLDDTYGLWKYTADAYAALGFSGLLGENSPHNAGARDWTFGNPDNAPTTYYIRVVSSLSYASYGYGFPFAAVDDLTYDACSVTGALSGTRAVYSSGTAVAQATLPFSFTLYGFTGKHISFGRRGIVTLSNVSQTDARNRQTDSGTNVDLPSASILPKPAIFAFWDNIRHNTTLSSSDGTAGQMCYKVVGAEPYRQAVVTWEDFRFGDTTGTLTEADRLHFSAVLFEGTNQIDVLFHTMVSPTSVDPGRPLGSGATVGIQDSNGALSLDDFNQPNYGTGASVAFVPIP